jgi:hypothetical protein
MERDAGTEDEELAIECVGRGALIPCKKSQMGRRHCLSKVVTVLYIITMHWHTSKEYNKNIYTFLRSYNRLGRVSCEYRKVS